MHDTPRCLKVTSIDTPNSIHDEDELSEGVSALDAALLDELIEGCQVIDHELTYVYANAAAAAQSHSTPEDLMGRSMLEVHPGIEGSELFENLRRCMRERVPLRMETEIRFGDGSPRWFDLRLEPVPMGVFMLSVDITTQRKAEQALQASQDEYRALLESLEDVVYAVDAQGRFTYVSPAVRRFGYEPHEVEGRPFADFLPPGDAPRIEELFAQAMQSGGDTRELRILDKQGSIHYVRSSSRVDRHGATPRGLTGILHDITEQRRIEEQFRAAQRLESVGRLAGGIAHDFNNLLSVVLTYSSFALESLSEDDPLHDDIDEIRKAGARAAELTRQLLAFSRNQVLKPEVVNLNRVLDDMKSMLMRLLPENIELVVRPAPALWKVEVDPGQIEQVVMNLVVNARDAMPRGGVLTLRTANAEIDPAQAERHIGARPGLYVMLSVTDTGSGMDPETQAKIFEPFFTTKEAGKGTGLGLSTVFGIVKQSGGSIRVQSEPGRGTSFDLYLPRIESPTGNLPRTMLGPVRSVRGETVLIVEDEEAVRNAARRILEAAGYTVLTAAHGYEALVLCEHLERPLDLLLTDIVMPQMSGREISHRLRERFSAMRTVFMSGYTDDTIAHHGVLDPDAFLVTKPFAAADLTRTIRAALDASP